MGRICVLDEHIAELIAAGEIIESPRAVIKELVENSIDARAKRIVVEIKSGGKTFMRVTDDGQGILEEDIKKAFLRHATSKVKGFDDLYSIATLGFRGEALASICAVSKVEVITKTENMALGFCYKISGGKEVSFEEVGCGVGTTIIVRDLFYNVPARMKFLKRDTTESNAISGLLDRMALSHPEISFNFIRDGKQEFLTLGDGKLQSNIYIIYGKEAASSMIMVKYKLGEILVSGAVSKPAYARPNRNMQHFFINGRYIKNITLASAVESAFRGYLMVKKFPVCVLHLSIPYDSVDVNIHPAKTEVKFLDDKSMFNAVYNAIKLALNAQDSYKIMKIKQDDLEQEQKLKLSDKSESKVGDKTLPSINGQVNRVEENAGKLSVNFDKPVRLKDNQDSAAINWVSKSRNEEDDRSIEISIPNVFGSIKDNYNKGELKRKIEIKENSELSHSVESDNKEQFFQNSKQPNFMAKTEPIDKKDTAILEDQMKVISEIFGTYILLEHKHELILVDKHAAHERILYEKLKKCSVKNLSQVLLSSMLTTLEKEEYAVLIENLSLLSEVGFDLEDFGSGTVLIRAIPMFLEIGEAKDTILEIAGKLMKNQSNFNIDKLDWIYHNVACRSAIKAGDKTKKEELLALIEELQQSPELKYCPHGRPIFISLKKSEIEKQFGRKK